MRSQSGHARTSRNRTARERQRMPQMGASSGGSRIYRDPGFGNALYGGSARNANPARSNRSRSNASRSAGTSRTARPERSQNVGRSQGRGEAASRSDLRSVSIGEIRRNERNERVQKKARNYAVRVFAILALIAALVIADAVVYNSDLFAIENVEIKGVEHLTSSDMTQMAGVPDNATLLRVNTDTIKSRIMKNAWVQDVHVNRVFPHTLEIDVTERTIKAVVSVPAASGTSTKQWAISEDHMWLMPIPDKDSDAGKATSEKVYEDADAALKIVNVPYGTKAEIGTYCTDSNVLNALDIVSGMTTELASQVVEVSASGPDETTLMLDNGIEIAFGKAENIRDKERVILQIMADNPDNVSYINVRTVTNPTWRTVS